MSTTSLEDLQKDAYIARKTLRQLAQGEYVHTEAKAYARLHAAEMLLKTYYGAWNNDG